MAFDYTALQGTATSLIALFGQSATLRKRGAKSGSASNPTYGPSVDTTVTAVDLAPKTINGPGGLVTETKRKILISGASASVPEKGDSVQIPVGITPWVMITSVTKQAPGGTAVYYECELES